MGVSGLDVQLSDAARSLFPYAVEAKSRASIAVYSFWDQCVGNSGPLRPLLVIKQNRSQPLAVITLDHFMELVSANQKSV